MKPLAIDLFCGAGGMSEGLIQAGFHIVYSSDINEDVKKTYTARHHQLGLEQGKNTFFQISDIRELTSEKIISSIANLEIFNGNSPDIDAIFGGPPCQGFSRAGERKKDDPRNTLFKEYLRIINDIRPKYVVMENVEGFNDTRFDGFIGVTNKTYPDNTLVPEILREEFTEIGYSTLEPQVLDASDFGVPQRRKRVIFIAYLDGMDIPSYPLPITSKEEDKITVNEAIGDLLENHDQNISFLSRYQIESRIGRTLRFDNLPTTIVDRFYNHEISKHDLATTERFSLFEQGDTAISLAKRIIKSGIDLTKYPNLLQSCHTKLPLMTIEEIVNSFNTGDVTQEMLKALLTKKSNRFRLKANSISPTVVTLPDDYLIPFKNRIPTVREMARIQSFDDSFLFLGKRTTGGSRRKIEVPQYTQVGNAVPPLLAKAIASEILIAIYSSKNMPVMNNT